MKARNIYWIAQLSGWSAYGALLLFSVIGRGDAIDLEIYVSIASWVIIGMAVTHVQRFLFLRLGWLDKKLPQLIPRLLFSSAICAFFLYSALLSVDYIMKDGDLDWERLTISTFIVSVAFTAFIVLFWNAIYFTFHFFQKSRKQEVSNLELTASNRESELKNLRSQLNPHFLFNSLNSIRALVDIEPAKAKTSITTLSNLLRQSLLVGKQNMVSIEQELDIVRNYLDLEKIRFEERLNVQWEIDDSLLTKEIPPFSIQMMAENAVKHGISNLKEGGIIVISIIRTDVGFALQLKNTGELGTTVDLGVGIQNIKQRLKLQFGSNASYTLGGEDGQVVAKIEFKDEGI
ncbi:MAG: histidine kinase [Crocinitomicaceae bacterium]|nr:histidine kinase [Crocinitomicaceae bacterium]